MATIVTRETTQTDGTAAKGSALTHGEVDANFINLNDNKLETNSDITVANATVTGNLTVQGSTTTLDTATLQVEDKNITLNYSTGDSSGSADGAGITIQDAVSSSTDATILWDATNDKFSFSHNIAVNGITLPAADGTSGQLIQTDGSGQLSFVDSPASDVVDDTTPQLGGTLDANGNNIDMGDNVITDTKVGQWDTAYGWGDHGAAGYLTSYTVTESDVTAHQAALSITESQISDLGTYLTAESDTLSTVTGRGNTTNVNLVTSANVKAGSGASDEGFFTGQKIYRSATGGSGLNLTNISTIRPTDNAGSNTNGTISLGESNYRFNNGYFNGTVTAGTLSVSAVSGDSVTLVDTNLTASASNIGNVRIAWDDSAGTRVAYVGTVNSDDFYINNQYSQVVLTHAGVSKAFTKSSGWGVTGDIDASGGLNVGGSSIGSRSNSISVVGDDNSSTIASKTTSYDTVFSVLPWSSSTTYLGTGIYYDDGNWVHASDNTTNSLLALTGAGVHWYANSGSATSFNVASNAPLWNSTGQWDGDINTTYDINTGSITAAGTGQFQAASGPVLFLKDTSGTGATNHNSWISFRDSGNTELGYVGYGSGSNTTFSVSNYSNGPVSLNGTAIIMGATVQIPDANTTISEGSGNALRFSTGAGYVDVGPMNTTWCHLQTDRGKFYFNKPVHMDGGAVDYDTGDHFLLPNANNSESPNLSTARNGGAINYIYNRGSNVTLTRGDFAHHIIQQWSGTATFTITSSTFLRGDIIEFINVRGTVTITVVGTRIYLPTGSYDTTLTLSDKGKFRLIKYSTSAGYWMLG